MHNDIFSIGPLTVHGYGLLIGIGIVAALLLSWRRAKSRELSPDTVTTLAIIALVFGFLGAKLLYLFAHFREFCAAPLATLGSEGFAVAGGLILGTLAVVFYCRKKHYSPLMWTDLLLPGVALAQGFGRIGCYLAGCCYGKATESALGVVFPVESSAPPGISLWPVQLFSSLGLFILAGFLLLTEKRKNYSGKSTSLYLLLYGIGRFGIEFIRDDPRGAVGALSTSQFISVFLVAGGIVLAVLCKKKDARN